MNHKDRILNLFNDNIVSDITPSDMRHFVNTVFDTKENTIRKLSQFNDLERVFPYPILKNDLIVVFEDEGRNGIYLALKDNPQVQDVQLVAGPGAYEDDLEILTQGESNQILSNIDGKLIWIEQEMGFQILGTKRIQDILLLSPADKNVIYIAENTAQFAAVPGFTGDGYSWDGKVWTNIGQLRGQDGTKGDTGDTGPAGPAGDGASELEKVLENGKIGWRILNRPPENYGDIGEGAIDLSYSAAASTVNGATGDYSVATGKGTQAKNSHSFVTGTYNNPKAGTIFEVGIGTEAVRQNAIEIYADGRVHAPSLSIAKQSDNHSFITTENINDRIANLLMDCGPFL